MHLCTVLVIAMAAWFAALWLRSRARSVPAGVSPVPDDLRQSTGHSEACMQALRAFATEYRLTFQHGGCTSRAVKSLHGLREEALRHLYQLRMRLPNDLDAEARASQWIEDTDAVMRSHLEDAQTRCGAPLLLPGPIDDAFYKRWYRAHNDVAA